MVVGGEEAKLFRGELQTLSPMSPSEEAKWELTSTIVGQCMSIAKKVHENVIWNMCSPRMKKLLITFFVYEQVPFSETFVPHVVDVALDGWR